MTSGDAEAMTALQELLDERQRYEGWIVALEQRKSATAPHVYTRVHTDYTLRLERVLHRLSERTEQLQSTIQLMTSRLNALRSRETDRIDARQEAELRAAVGEYADDEWATMRDDADREIAAIAEERRGVELELFEIERIVEMTRTSQVLGAEPEADPSSMADGVSAPESAGQISEGSTPSIQNFLTDAPVSVAEPPSQVAQSVGANELSQPLSAVPVGTPSLQTEASAPAPLEPKRDNEKTLKCPECGGLNYATEWYCERCGGELATF